MRKPGGRETTTLEFRELRAPAGVGRAAGRTGFRQQLVALLERQYRGWKFERVSNRSDREHSFSAWYTRGLARQGRSAWAFLGLSEEEATAAADGVLAFGLIWLDWLRSQADRVAITQLKLFLPPPAVSLIAHRAAYLNPRALNVEIYEWRVGQPSATPVDLKDYGNVETRLAARRQAELLKESHASLLHDLLGELSAGIDIVPDSAGTFSSLRIAGLEVARIEGQLAPRIYFGLEGSVRRLDESCQDEFRDFLREVRRIRCAGSPTLSTNFTGFSPSDGSKACSAGTLPGLIRRFHPRMFIRRFRHFRGPIEGSLTFSPRRAGDGWRWWNSRSMKKSTSPFRGWITGCA